MIVAGSASPLLLSSGGYNLTKSLRFRSSASAYLNRTGGTPTDGKKFTLSFWLKRGTLTTSSAQWFFTGGATNNVTLIGFPANADTLQINQTDSVGQGQTTVAVFRDPSAWYHFVVAIDTTDATNANRIKIYVNGTLQTTTTSGTVTQNSTWGLNSANVLNIGRYGSGVNSNYLDGYLAEVNFIDGQALTPSSFGETSAATGVWIPKKYTGTYGTNGFYLPFTDVATTSGSNAGLGKDFSGNGNYWTTNNISVTSGSTYDSMKDVPTLTDTDTANYCTLNPLNIVSPSTISGGNLNFDTGTSGGGGVYANWNYPESGKFYHELSNLSGVGTANGRASAANVYWESNTGDVYISGVFAANVGTWNDTNTLGFAADCGAKTIALYRNNSLLYTASAGNAMFSSPVAYAADGSGSFAISGSFNFGQQPFAYTPPTGFKALNTFNLPTPTIGATASSQANKYMDATLYTGTGASLSVTNANSFQPDMVWIKCRSNARDNKLTDSVRGTTKGLISNTTGAETTDTNGLTAFNSNGFTIGSDAVYNTSTNTYVAWQWKANGSGSSNTAGSITSTVSANTTAGFSIVTYTGTGANATVGHGLGVAPSMIICKSRDVAGNSWATYHVSLGNTKAIYLNLTNTPDTNSGFWNNTSPTSTVFSVGTLGDTNQNTKLQLAYCFAEVAGYSAFGSYTGNGSSDGPFVFTGFRPRYVLIKSTVEASNWLQYDTARMTYNKMDTLLYPSLSNAENTDSTYAIDVVSNGFKIRGTGQYGGYNNNGNAYIYMAFAESPFKYANAR